LIGGQAKGAGVMHELASRALYEEEVGKFSSRLEQSRGWQFHLTEYPVLDVSFTAEGRTAIRLRLNCVDWDEKPPSIELLNLDGTPLTALPPNLTAVFNPGPHPQTSRPFICMRGSREYHIHPSHLTDLWENYRHQTDNMLGGLLTQLWHAWLKGNA